MKATMVRLNSYVERHMFDTLQAVAKEEGVAYSEVVRQVLKAGMLARQDQQSHHTRMFTLIESLEAKVKDHEDRLCQLESNAPAPSS